MSVYSLTIGTRWPIQFDLFNYRNHVTSDAVSNENILNRELKSNYLHLAQHRLLKVLIKVCSGVPRPYRQVCEPSRDFLK